MIIFREPCCFSLGSERKTEPGRYVLLWFSSVWSLCCCREYRTSLSGGLRMPINEYMLRVLFFIYFQSLT